MDDRIKRAGQEAGQFLRGTAQESFRRAKSDHGDETERRGFTAAAGIALRQIDARLDDFTEQMTSHGLTKADQAAYADLKVLKSQIEAECDGYWRGSGLEWRPVKPVAKGSVRRTEEPPSQD